MDIIALTEKVKRLRAHDGILLRNWTKHYKSLPGKADNEDWNTKIARVLLAGNIHRRGIADLESTGKTGLSVATAGTMR